MASPGLVLKEKVNEFMGSVIDEAYAFAPNEFVFKRFRKKVLDSGNQLIREFNEELAAHDVRYKITREELLNHGKATGS